MQGARYCLGVSSGTDALHVALLALGIGPGDRVALPVNTFMATAEAVSLTGAVPVFVDCDGYYNMDTDQLELMLKKHSDEGHPVKAIIPVHLYGQPADMSRIAALAEA
jgi:dTDP-4-amino-4,6-dideoxygalactose transaminase